MQWYYSEAGTQHGPLTDTVFLEHLRTGRISRSTLVWREGMAAWLPLQEVDTALLPREAMPPILAPPLIPVATDTVCAECGLTFAPDELIVVSGHRICAGCKPAFLQRLQEGAPLTALAAHRGVHRNGKNVVIENGAVMPERCVYCNAPTTWRKRRKFHWNSPWVYLLVFAPLVLIIVALVTRKTMQFDVLLCGEHSQRRKLNLRIWWGLFFGALVGIVGTPLLATQSPFIDDLVVALEIGFIVLFFTSLVLASRAASILTTQQIGRNAGAFRRAGRDYLASLPQWRGGEL